MGVITATLGIDCNNTLVYIYHNSPEIFNNNFVIKYIQRVKIETARMSLESSRENISEVMYKVGYNDTRHSVQLSRRSRDYPLSSTETNTTGNWQLRNEHC